MKCLNKITYGQNYKGMKVLKNEPALSKPHNIILENRQKIRISGVNDMDSFDTSQIVLYTEQGELIIKGKGFKMNNLNTETGEFSMEGEISAMVYSQNRSKANVFTKLFR